MKKTEKAKQDLTLEKDEPFRPTKSQSMFWTMHKYLYFRNGQFLYQTNEAVFEALAGLVWFCCEHERPLLVVVPDAEAEENATDALRAAVAEWVDLGGDESGIHINLIRIDELDGQCICPYHAAVCLGAKCLVAAEGSLRNKRTKNQRLSIFCLGLVDEKLTKKQQGIVSAVCNAPLIS